jgi:hypothetical protein
MPDPATGARRRHDQAAELGLLVLHNPWGTGDDQRTRQPQQRERRDHQALKGLANHSPGVTGPGRQGFPYGRPAAGLDRPPDPAHRQDPTRRARTPTTPRPHRLTPRPIELLFEERPLDKTHCFRHAAPARSSVRPATIDSIGIVMVSDPGRVFLNSDRARRGFPASRTADG